MNWPFWCVIGWVGLAVALTDDIVARFHLARMLKIYKELGTMFDKSIAREQFLAREIIKHAKKGAPNGRN